ncbi:MAG: GDYXXLXY domain-containing protein [Bacteroidota bacterium]
MYRNIAFILTMILYAGFPLQMISGYESVLSEGELHRFQPRPIDPYNPFKGRYVFLQYENPKLEYENGRDVFEYGTSAYISLEKDSAGIAQPKEIFPVPPEEGNYLRVEINYITDNEVGFHYPFDEYYMNEEMAPKAEAAVRDFSEWGKEEVFVDVRIKEGMAVIEQLYIQDKPIEEFLREAED